VTTCRYIKSDQSNLTFEQLGEFQVKFNIALGYGTGTLVGTIDEKNTQ
jgi:hypothetical protein